MVAGEFSNFEKASVSIASMAEKVAAGGHAAPVAGAHGIATVPSRHRLYNAAGGIGGWLVGRYIMNVLVGETPQGKKIDKEKVLPPLRPFYGILAYNRYADDPHNQWMRVIDDLTPAIIGSVGAVMGSKYFFVPKEQDILKAANWEKHKSIEGVMADPTISMLNKDALWTLKKPAHTWRVLSGISGVFSASSGMALLVAPFNIMNYGVGLNNAFSLANGAVPGNNLFKKTPILKWIYSTVANTSHAPLGASKALINNVSRSVERMEELGKIALTDTSHASAEIKAENEGRINEMVNAIVLKLFPKAGEKGVQAFKAEVHKAIDNAIADAAKVKSTGGTPAHLSKYVKAELEKILLGVDVKKLEAAAAQNIKEGKKVDYQYFEKKIEELAKKDPGFADPKYYGNHGFAGWLGEHPKVAYGSVAAAGAAGITAIALTDKKPHPADALVKKHKAEEDANKPAQASSNPVTRFVNGPVLRFGRWLSDAVVVVPPQNRLFSALGLSGGLWVGYRGMRALARKDFDGTPLDLTGKIKGAEKIDKIDPLVNWCTTKLRAIGVKLDFDYFINTPANRVKRGIFWVVPTVTGLVGLYYGSKFAFRKQYKDLEHPEYLEDYTAKVALKQGDKWGWLSATAGVMASSSGFSNLPIPGLNYSIGLSTRSVLSYDKKTTMPGMKWWSNNKSNYYFGLKGAQEFTVKYALRNPSADPVELAPLAEATLAPIFPKVTKEQVAQYVDKIQTIRHKYWQSGVGIPHEKQAVAEKELRAILRGAGFEKTLVQLGLDPAKAVFDNGAAGTIANAIGAKKTVNKLSDEYRAKYSARKEAQPKAAPVIDVAAEVTPEKTTTATHTEHAQPRRPSERVAPAAASHAETIKANADDMAHAGSYGRI